jgi:hypothetical protein
MEEDFSDGVADYFQPQTGLWQVSEGRYQAMPIGDAITTLRISQPLPTSVELAAVVNAEPPSGSLYGNAYLVFDYQSPTDFKYAGVSIGAGTWTIGHRSGSSWTTDAATQGTISGNTDYAIEVRIEDDSRVTLLVDGSPQVSFDFGGLLTDGDVGLATWNAISGFDDVTLAQYNPPPGPPSATLPMEEDFEDGTADYFEPRTGIWDVTAGRYEATPAGDAITTIRTEQPLPPDLQLQAVINASPVSGSFYSNAYLIFDYQSPTDFKFAGASVGSGKWVIGHRSGTKWTTVASVAGSISSSTDYDIEIVIRDDSQVTLYVNGAPQTNYMFTGSLTDGEVGLATWNAFSRFDDVALQPFVSGMGIAGVEATDNTDQATQADSQMALPGAIGEGRRRLPSELAPHFVDRAFDTSRDALQKWLVTP